MAAVPSVTWLGPFIGNFWNFRKSRDLYRVLWLAVDNEIFFEPKIQFGRCDRDRACVCRFCRQRRSTADPLDDFLKLIFLFEIEMIMQVGRKEKKKEETGTQVTSGGWPRECLLIIINLLSSLSFSLITCYLLGAQEIMSINAGGSCTENVSAAAELFSFFRGFLKEKRSLTGFNCMLLQRSLSFHSELLLQWLLCLLHLLIWLL